MTLRVRDEKAERAVIGLVLAGAPASATALRQLDDADFTTKEIRWLFSVTRELFPKVGTPSAEVLLHELEDDGAESEIVEGYGRLIRQFLTDIEGLSATDLPYWIERVRKRTRARRLVETIQGTEETEGVLELLEDDRVEEAEAAWMHAGAKARALDSAADRGDYLADFEERYARVKDMIANPDKYRGIFTGIGFLDHATGGLMEQEFGMLIGKTGTGKTSSLVFMAHQAWCQGKNVVFVTIECPKPQIEYKLDSRIAGVSSTKLRLAFVPGAITEDDLRKWRRAIKRERKRRKNLFYTLDMPEGCRPADIQAQLRELSAELGVTWDQIYLDHLGLMEPNKPTEGGSTDWKNQIQLANEIKQLVRTDGHLSAWAAVQAKGNISNRKMRTASSGEVVGLYSGLTQPANLAIVISRDDDDESEGDTRMLWWSLNKSRYGGEGRKRVQYHGATCYFTDQIEDDDELGSQ